MRLLLPLLILTLLEAGCGTTPLSEDPAVRRLTVRNSEGLEVELARVGGDIVLPIGNAPVTELVLQAERYVVYAGGLARPAPLLDEALGSNEALVLELTSEVAAPPGFVFIPGGPTLIGDRLGVGAVHERPLRVVEVAPFLVAERETTNAQYVAFLNARRNCREDWIDLGGPKCRIRRSPDGTFLTDAPRLPVVTVSYPGAVAYCAWKSEATGQRHRLPTEIEWERFARGPISSTYAYGDVYDSEAANQESGCLLEVGSFPPTGWGVYDATGNAFEWTASEFEPGLQVLKGGSYVLDGPYLRNAFRMWYRPLVQADDIGFRVVREIEE